MQVRVRQGGVSLNPVRAPKEKISGLLLTQNKSIAVNATGYVPPV